MTTDEIIKQLESLRDNSKSFIDLPIRTGQASGFGYMGLKYAIALTIKRPPPAGKLKSRSFK